MSIEGPVSIQVIEGEEDQLKIDESNLSDKLSDAFLLQIGDLDKYMEIEEIITSKIKSVIIKINSGIKELLNINGSSLLSLITHDKRLKVKDGDEEFKVIDGISEKLNIAINDFLNNQVKVSDTLFTSLDEISAPKELIKILKDSQQNSIKMNYIS